MSSGFDAARFAREVEMRATESLTSASDGALAEAARRVRDLAEAACRTHVGRDEVIACRAGCSHCCIVNVAVLAPEAALIVDHLSGSRTAAELTRLQDRLSRLDLATRTLDDDERIMVRRSCAFLDRQGRCAIYPVRPLLCRSVTSTDADQCRDALAMVAFDENRPIVSNLVQRDIFETAFSSLGRALQKKNMDSQSRRLTGSVRHLLGQHLEQGDIPRRLPEDTMNSEQTVQDAIYQSLLTEKDAMDFYNTAAQYVRDADARRMLELLALEEREHAEWFHRICNEMDLAQFLRLIESGPDPESDWMSKLNEITGKAHGELDVLQLAMRQEKELERELIATAAATTNPEVRRIYEANIESTRRHFNLIVEEFNRLKELLEG